VFWGLFFLYRFTKLEDELKKRKGGGPQRQGCRYGPTGRLVHAPFCSSPPIILAYSLISLPRPLAVNLGIALAIASRRSLGYSR
jgi:hypothetical protein